MCEHEPAGVFRVAKILVLAAVVREATTGSQMNTMTFEVLCCLVVFTFDGAVSLRIVCHVHACWHGSVECATSCGGTSFNWNLMHCYYSLCKAFQQQRRLCALCGLLELDTAITAGTSFRVEGHGRLRRARRYRCVSLHVLEQAQVWTVGVVALLIYFMTMRQVTESTRKAAQLFDMFLSCLGESTGVESVDVIRRTLAGCCCSSSGVPVRRQPSKQSTTLQSCGTLVARIPERDRTCKRARRGLPDHINIDTWSPVCACGGMLRS
eukprot:2865840-Amphidinium_carterae.1